MMITVPGIIVVPRERKLMILGMENIKSLPPDQSRQRFAFHRQTGLRLQKRDTSPQVGKDETHSIPLCCTTDPFNFPSIFIAAMSFTWLACTNAGPMGQAPSKDFE